MDRYENGKEIKYTLQEDAVVGYDTNIDISQISDGNIVSATITNTHTPEKINIEGTKTWNDNNNQESKRPDTIQVNLYADGVKVKTLTISKNDDWKYIISNLDKYKNGKEINYTIDENPVEFYTTKYDKFNIINTITETKKYNEVLPPQTGVKENNNSNILLYVLALISTVCIIFTPKEES